MYSVSALVCLRCKFLYVKYYAPAFTASHL